MRHLLVIAITVLSFGPLALAQTTLPSLERGALEIRANQEFNRGQYALALPIFKKLADMSKDQPEALGQLQEKIRVCERNLAKEAQKQSAATQPALGLDRKPHAPPADGQALDLTIKELGNFSYDEENGGNIPEDVKTLTGQRLRIRGFMIPVDQAANITQFALVPDLFACCFGQPPQLQHTIMVKCPPGKAVSYYPDEISVEGKLIVEEKREEGFILSIFEVEAASVKPAAK